MRFDGTDRRTHVRVTRKASTFGPPDGTAADVIKRAMVPCHAALAESGLATKLLLTIHDELLFEGPPDEAAAARELIVREMVGVWEPRQPPMAVDIGTAGNWLDAK